MRFSAAEIQPIARPDGFDERVVEKVLHLVHLLNTLNSHPSLRGKWVLKGGTALNLFVRPHPRLSVDIDLNYIGALERENMLADRPKIEQAAQAVLSQLTPYNRVMPSPGQWRFRDLPDQGRLGSVVCLPPSPADRTNTLPERT